MKNIRVHLQVELLIQCVICEITINQFVEMIMRIKVLICKIAIKLFNLPQVVKSLIIIKITII